MERYRYSFRSDTYIGQKINKDVLTQTLLFWNEIHTTIKEKGFYKNNIFKIDSI